eukprot:5736150-Alexandrium_andersonii.AAC.1
MFRAGVPYSATSESQWAPQVFEHGRLRQCAPCSGPGTDSPDAARRFRRPALALTWGPEQMALRSLVAARAQSQSP